MHRPKSPTNQQMADPQAPQEQDEDAYNCAACKAAFTGLRYRCHDCPPTIELCPPCFAVAPASGLHPGHHISRTGPVTPHQRASARTSLAIMRAAARANAAADAATEARRLSAAAAKRVVAGPDADTEPGGIAAGAGARGGGLVALGSGGAVPQSLLHLERARLCYARGNQHAGNDGAGPYAGQMEAIFGFASAHYRADVVAAVRGRVPVLAGEVNGVLEARVAGGERVVWRGYGGVEGGVGASLEARRVWAPVLGEEEVGRAVRALEEEGDEAGLRGVAGVCRACGVEVGSGVGGVSGERSVGRRGE
ncbi:hypothetical protein LTR08_007634 [Meristemomyces frigidus]|nr:hypothetical protein LTR08_007634 [Meristemomyces frigidus]